MATVLQNNPGPANAAQPGPRIGWPTAIHETALPLLFAIAAIVVFIRIDQAREALFGTIGPVPHSFNRVPKPYDQYIGTQFFALVAAMAFIGVGVWYTARLLLTVERTTRHGAAGAAPSRAIEVYPRLIGALTPAMLIIAFVIVQESRRTDHRLGAGRAVCLPGAPVRRPLRHPQEGARVAVGHRLAGWRRGPMVSHHRRRPEYL